MFCLCCRQYLSHEGVGSGTPGQRERQYQKFRAMRAAENVFEHRAGKLTSQYETRLATADDEGRKRRHRDDADLRRSKKQLTKNAIERLVEDLISESMARGEFDNLKVIRIKDQIHCLMTTSGSNFEHHFDTLVIRQ